MTKKQLVILLIISLAIITLAIVFSNILAGKVFAGNTYHETVCFCHNVNNNPHTICTDNQGEINGHQTHVNNGQDYVGECGVNVTTTPIPTICQKSPTPTPTIINDITPTATPEATPTGKIDTTTSHSDGDTNVTINDTTHNSNPTCDTPKPSALDHLVVDSGILHDGKVTLLWPHIVGATSVDMFYGEYGKPFVNGVANWPDIGTFEINYLKDTNYNFCIQGRNGCARGPMLCVDPAT